MASAGIRSAVVIVRMSHTVNGTSCGGGDNTRQALKPKKRWPGGSVRFAALSNGLSNMDKALLVESTCTNRAGRVLARDPYSPDFSLKRNTPYGAINTLQAPVNRCMSCAISGR